MTPGLSLARLLVAGLVAVLMLAMSKAEASA
ncbi:MAG: hypothetical protein KatS3mg128_0205 [Silanimonas sp.]|nr:MAG: hypothetical protein KatS3mg128_0205 [Silanimonas sp.]